jgi:hypothetical protein
LENKGEKQKKKKTSIQKLKKMKLHSENLPVERAVAATVRVKYPNGTRVRCEQQFLKSK